MSGDIVYELLSSLRVHLQDKMIDNVPSAYQSMLTYTDQNGVDRVFKPSQIQVGRLQDDPTELSASAAEPSCLVAIHGNDPDDMGDGWKHSVASAVEGSMTNAGFLVGRPYEFGGTETWWRRLRIELACYFIDSDQTQAEAARLGNALRALTEIYAHHRCDAFPHGWAVWDVSDVFGETAREAYAAKAHMAEGGGPEDDYIWRGGVWTQVLTVRE